MKILSGLRVCMPLLGLGAFLALAPQCRAQAEISPDHFDGTDPWELALKSKPVVPSAKSGTAGVIPVRGKKHGTSARTQMASAKHSTDPQAPELVAIQEKRKLQARKSDNPQ